MPTYDYGCVACGHVFETFHGMTESPDVSCPQCFQSAERRLSLGAGLMFKGSGFYVTDYKPSAAAAASESPASTASPGGGCGTGGCGAGGCGH
jgi:putative FmdB family regulatory protein